MAEPTLGVIGGSGLYELPGLSAVERQIVVTADIDLGQLGGIYGIAFSGPATSLAHVDAAVLAQLVTYVQARTR